MRKKSINLRAMEQLPSLIKSLSSLIPSANIGHFISIIQGIYSISSGGVTQLNISRYCSISYRSVQRFMSTDISWHQLLITMLRVHLANYSGVYLLAIDETVEDKAGKCTDKIGYFFSSKLGKVIKSVSFGVLSLIAVGKRKSYVVDFTQLSQDAAKTAENKAKKAVSAQKKKDKKAGMVVEVRPSGRPVGSKNKVKTKVESESSRALTLLLTRVLPFLASIFIHPSYLVGDGAYGNLTYCLLAAEKNLFLISKLNPEHSGRFCFIRLKREQDNVFMGIKWILHNYKPIKLMKKRKMTVFLPFFKLKRSEPEILDSGLMSLLFGVIIKKVKNQDSFCYFLPI